MADSHLTNVCRTEVTPDGRYVRVTFECDNAEDVVIVVPVSQYTSLVDLLQKQAEHLAPQGRVNSLLKRGQEATVDGFRLLPDRDGELVLTVYARVYDAEGDRGLTFPIKLSAEAAQNLRDKLDHRLSNEDIG